MLGTANYLLPEGWRGGQSEDSWHSPDIEMNERGEHFKLCEDRYRVCVKFEAINFHFVV